MTSSEDNLPHVGWREWVSLPELGVDWIKAKVDTGARTSALHAYEMERFERDGLEWVRCVLHPFQRDVTESIEVEAQLVDERIVRSSSGKPSLRPVIRTTLGHGADRWSIELTLVSRDEMGFRMLLGREALRGRLVVDPGRSYLGGKPPREVRRRNRKAVREHRQKHDS